MAWEVEIHHFQAIEHIRLELEGYVVLEGPSNIGKSAIFRAVKGLLTNQSGTSFVRHAASCVRQEGKKCGCFSRVRLANPDLSLDVLWEKGDKVNRYTVNGVLHDKVERGVPAFLAPLKLHPFLLGDDEVCLHVSDQFRPVFLLDRRPTEVAEAISDVGHLDRLHEALRLSESDRREAGMTRKVREQDMATVKTRLGAYEGLSDVVAEVGSVEAALGGLEAQQRLVDRVGEWDARVTSLEQGRDGCLETLEATVLDGVPGDLEGVRWLTRWLTLQEQAERRLAALEPILSLGCEPPPTVDVTGLALVAKALGLQAELESYPLLPDLDPPPGVNTYQTFVGPFAQAQKLAAEVRALKAQLDTLGAQVSALEAEIAALGPLCPTCQRPLETHA